MAIPFYSMFWVWMVLVLYTSSRSGARNLCIQLCDIVRLPGYSSSFLQCARDDAKVYCGFLAAVYASSSEDRARNLWNPEKVLLQYGFMMLSYSFLGGVPWIVRQYWSFQVVQDDPERLRWLKRATEVPISVAELALKTGILPGSMSSPVELVPVLERKCPEKLLASLKKTSQSLISNKHGQSFAGCQSSWWWRCWWTHVDPLSRYHQEDFAVYHWGTACLHCKRACKQSLSWNSWQVASRSRLIYGQSCKTPRPAEHIRTGFVIEFSTIA